MQMHNFNSGPSILPEEVLQQAAEAIHDFHGTGLSILEIGHRTSWFMNVMEEARSLVKELLNLNDEYEVLFLQGGDTMQFMQVPLNLLDSDESADYCDNGIWGSKAIKEAKVFGNVNVVSSTKDRNHSYIRKDFTVSPNAKYFHYTTNNTVEGTQWHTIPETNGVPLIADMSSDIFSRQIDFSKFSLIHAGAQKNAGAAGATIVVIKKEILGKVKRNISPIMDYRNHIAADSLLNTPPVFAVYVSMLTLRWIKESGGLQEMELRATDRADLFYSALDRLPIFTPLVAKEDRSLMNATFTIKDEMLENKFLEECKQNGMVGIRGHRSVGGLRVSMYNAMPVSSVKALIDLMTDFARRNG
ncbi:MAG: 3-phosphoserine/phosphohydroxythreonine transaminase [Chitinophagaceae bacterium]|jgi:phosphoserine aminotransferase|nr:3-phosphoserine/phosphohydroxythreonine transaminase [Chitinophagaceae bacterium]